MHASVGEVDAVLKVTPVFRKLSAPDRHTIAPLDPILLQGGMGVSEIMNHSGRKGGSQGVQHGQNVDDFLGDGAAHRT